MILPCPFCGIDPVWVKDRYGGQLECHNVECYAQPSIRADDEDDAIAVWNRRPSPPVVDGELPDADTAKLIEQIEIAVYRAGPGGATRSELIDEIENIILVALAPPKSPRSEGDK